MTLDRILVCKVDESEKLLLHFILDFHRFHFHENKEKIAENKPKINFPLQDRAKSAVSILLNESCEIDLLNYYTDVPVSVSDHLIIVSFVGST